MTRLVSTVTSSRHPAAWGAFGAAIIVGSIGAFVPDGTSNAVDRALPVWFVHVYYFGLIVAGTIGILALLLDDLERRLRVERCAWYGVGWPAIFYAAAALTNNGVSAAQAAVFCGVFSPVATARIIQITRDLHRLREDQAESRPEVGPW